MGTKVSTFYSYVFLYFLGNRTKLLYRTVFNGCERVMTYVKFISSFWRFPSFPVSVMMLVNIKLLQSWHRETIAEMIVHEIPKTIYGYYFAYERIFDSVLFFCLIMQLLMSTLLLACLL